MLAADASGAWFISGRREDGAHLTRVLAGGTGTAHEYPLGLTPTGIAAGERAVWIVGRAPQEYQVLRVDPATGLVTRRTRFPASTPIASIAVGFGYVWVVDPAHATLYRINARTSTRAGKVVLGHPPATRPEPLRGSIVSVGYTTKAGSAAWVDAHLLYFGDVFCGCQPGQGDTFTAFGSDWWDDWPTGTVHRQSSDTAPVQLISVTAIPAHQGGPCLTSMTAGAGSTWVTVSQHVADFFSCTE